VRPRGWAGLHTAAGSGARWRGSRACAGGNLEDRAPQAGQARHCAQPRRRGAPLAVDVKAEGAQHDPFAARGRPHLHVPEAAAGGARVGEAPARGAGRGRYAGQGCAGARAGRTAERPRATESPPPCDDARAGGADHRGRRQSACTKRRTCRPARARERRRGNPADAERVRRRARLGTLAARGVRSLGCDSSRDSARGGRGQHLSPREGGAGVEGRGAPRRATHNCDRQLRLLHALCRLVVDSRNNKLGPELCPHLLSGMPDCPQDRCRLLVRRHHNGDQDCRRIAKWLCFQLCRTRQILVSSHPATRFNSGTSGMCRRGSVLYRVMVLGPGETWP